MGLNVHSDPQGAAYTSTVPARTTVAAFQAGGAEAMAYGTGSEVYWSSSEGGTNGGTVWTQRYQSNAPVGEQVLLGKSNNLYARAVRRSII